MSIGRKNRKKLVHWYNPTKYWFKVLPGHDEPSCFYMINAACNRTHKGIKSSSFIGEITCPDCKNIFVLDGGQMPPDIREVFTDEVSPESKAIAKKILGYDMNEEEKALIRGLDKIKLRARDIFNDEEELDGGS